MIQKIKRRLQLEKLKPTTIENYLVIASKLPITREELEDWLTSVGPHRHNFILAVLKKFVHYKIIDASLIKDLVYVSTRNHKRIKTKSDLLTQDEIIAIVHEAPRLRDKALIYSLYEGFPRITEFLTLERKHFSFTKDFIRVTIPQSKSQPRVLILVESAGHVKNYLVHVRGDDPGLFWYPDNSKSQDDLTELEKRTMVNTFRRQLQRVAARAGITKNASPHRLRHAGATVALKKYRPETVRQTGGWEKHSRSMAEYIHLAQEDAEEDVLLTHGIIEKSNDLPVMLQCPYCGTRNNTLLERCTTCAKLLQLDLDKIQSDESLMVKVLERDDVQDFLRKIIKEELSKENSD